MTYVAPSHSADVVAPVAPTVATVQPVTAATVVAAQPAAAQPQATQNTTPAGKRKRNPDALKKCMACGELINGDYFAYQHIKSKPCAQLQALGITNQVEYDEHFYQLKPGIVEPATVEKQRKQRAQKPVEPTAAVAVPVVVPQVAQQAAVTAPVVDAALDEFLASTTPEPVEPTGDEFLAAIMPKITEPAVEEQPAEPVLPDAAESDLLSIFNA